MVSPELSLLLDSRRPIKRNQAGNAVLQTVLPGFVRTLKGDQKSRGLEVT